MDTDRIITTAGDLLGRVPSEWLAGALVVLVLLVIYLKVRRSPRPSRVVIGIGTLIGLGWSAQGMWDTAVHTYEVDSALATVLFCMFEALFVGAMMEANHFRHDLVRRRAWVQTVWTLAIVMALVVALGEGWAQAPLRLSVPIVLALIWYRALTADDDPAQRAPTSVRWTPRRLLLAVGAIEPGDRDERTINRDRLRDTMVRLEFRERYGWEWLASLTRTKIRRARLATDATDDDLSVVRQRITRAARVMTPERQEPAPVPPGLSLPPARRPRPDLDRRVQGVHARAGKVMRGSELKADAMDLVTAAERAGKPITNAELAALYEPPLGSRTADTYAAAARSLVKMNGHRPQ